jgi:hypothetical protein
MVIIGTVLTRIAMAGIINKKGYKGVKDSRVQVKSKKNIQKQEPRFFWQGFNFIGYNKLFSLLIKGFSNISMEYEHGYDSAIQQFDKHQTRTVNIKQFLIHRINFLLPIYS